MTSILKVDTIQDTAGNNIINESSDTITIGASGDTITIPSGATISNLGTASGFGGITNAQQWYHTATTTLTSSAIILPSWSAHNGTKIGSIGSNVSVASGKFSFSSTGIYQINARISYFLAGAALRYALSSVMVSTDAGSTFTNVDESVSGLPDIGTTDYTFTINNYILDVDDTANIQVAIYAATEITAQIENYNKATTISFVRLGDT
jgi:hypothetical protein